MESENQVQRVKYSRLQDTKSKWFKKRLRDFDLGTLDQVDDFDEFNQERSDRNGRKTKRNNREEDR